MKKLFFIALFSIGLFSMTQAQDLDYYVENQTSVDWDVTLLDDGPSGAVNLSLSPGASASGTISDFAFDLELSADNNAGCAGSNTESGTIIGGSIPLLCLRSFSINYAITGNASTGYNLHLEISN